MIVADPFWPTAECREIQSLNQRKLDGELGARDATRIEDHHRTCPACRAEFDELLEVATLLLEASERDRVPLRDASPAQVTTRSIASRWRGAAAAGLLAGITLVLATPRQVGDPASKGGSLGVESQTASRERGLPESAVPPSSVAK